MTRVMMSLLLAPALALAAGAQARDTPPKVGQPAPAFTATDNRGAMRSLSEFRGTYVVLEWHNNGCPYVRKHYDSHNMQNLQKTWTGKGVAWLTIVSSAPGTQGFVSAEQSRAFVAQADAAPTAVLLDPTGTVGHLYAATNTPQMFVIDPAGVLIYSGAIDDRPSADPSTLQGAHNLVSAALTDAMARRPVATPVSVPYGCTVKYAR